jgi:hypothetical protein
MPARYSTLVQPLMAPQEPQVWDAVCGRGLLLHWLTRGYCSEPAHRVRRCAGNAIFRLQKRQHRDPGDRHQEQQFPGAIGPALRYLQKPEMTSVQYEWLAKSLGQVPGSSRAPVTEGEYKSRFPKGHANPSPEPACATSSPPHFQRFGIFRISCPNHLVGDDCLQLKHDDEVAPFALGFIRSSYYPTCDLLHAAHGRKHRCRDRLLSHLLLPAVPAAPLGPIP